MKKTGCKYIFTAVLTLAMVLSLTGCLFSGKTSKTLLNYFGECEVKAARCYDFSGKDPATEELDASRVSELVGKLESMTLKTKSFHADYYWGGKFGIELELADGTYLTYDGTKLEHRNDARPENNGNNIESVFAEVTNMKFWEEMESFFQMAKSIRAR